MNSTPSASEIFLGGAYQIPQYVLACLPVIAVIGAISTQADLCCYYLDKEYFARGTKSIPFRPFGLHAMKLEPTYSQLKCFSECCSEASVLERLG
ncbi:29888_t:CDS:2, partial [Gigaspora margarita]